MSRTIKIRMISGVITVILTAIIGWVINYFALPAMTVNSSGFWWYWFSVGAIAATIYFISNGILNYFECEEGGHLPGVIVGGIAIVWLLVFLATAIACSEITNAIDYSNVITVEERNFADIAEIDVNDIVVVDVKTAQRLGDRTIGTIKNASWYDVDDEYNLVVINGEKYRISPLNYGGVWKYFKADESGIPGYVLVEASNKDAEARFVELEEPIKYSPSACFEYDLTRHLRNQYPSAIFGSKSFFEVDDAGHPYWITGVKTPQVGMRGALITTSAVVTDAITGESQEYKLENLPEWVDHVQSVEELMELAYWHYSYWDGWWNDFTSQTGVYQTSYLYKDQEQSKSQNEGKVDLAANKYTPFEGYNSIVKDGKVMFYTGLTPANNAESNTGFLLIDPKNKEFFYYGYDEKKGGAEESSAQGAVEGLVSDLRYSASFPTIVNVEGIATYFMVLKDGAGLIQRFAFANVENYAKCVQAETIEKALEAYKIEIGLSSPPEENNNNNDNSQNQQDNTNTNQPEVEALKLSGKVLDVKEAQIGGYTYYYFTIEGANAFVFMSSIENSNEQPMKLQAGSNVNVEYYESEKETGICIVTAISFE